MFEINIAVFRGYVLDFFLAGRSDVWKDSYRR